MKEMDSSTWLRCHFLDIVSGGLSLRICRIHVLMEPQPLAWSSRIRENREKTDVAPTTFPWQDMSTTTPQACNRTTCCRMFKLNRPTKMKIEAIWYEYSPYLYAVGGVVSVSNFRSYISIISGVMLLIASATILRMRWIYRKNVVLQRERDERLRRVAKRKLLKPTVTLAEDDEL